MLAAVEPHISGFERTLAGKLSFDAYSNMVLRESRASPRESRASPRESRASPPCHTPSKMIPKDKLSQQQESKTTLSI